LGGLLAQRVEQSPGVTGLSKTAVPQAADVWLRVESLDLDAQGVAHQDDGKVVFIEGALPFEDVRYQCLRSKNNWEQGVMTELRHESSQRVRPRCPHFGLHTGACGGCKVQHLDAAAQVAVKQRALEDQLWHLGKVRPQTVLRALQGPAWHYRYRARLSVRYVPRKGVVLIGFHERKSRYIADMTVCPVLPDPVSRMLVPLRELIGSLDARERCPQIELACGDAPGAAALGTMALVLRHLQPLSEADRARLHAFALAHPGVQWWLQPQGPDSVHLLDIPPGAAPGALNPAGVLLAYELPDFGLTMPFRPTDFTQVNPHINRALLARALQLLDVQSSDRVIDWFCGLGNFTLPLATRAGEVLGIEGSPELVARANENYARNRPACASRRALAPAHFVARNLFEMTPEMLERDGRADRWLIDPPREGAFALVKALADLHQRQRLQPLQALQVPGGWAPPQRIVYVSCNPATLARDAGLLVHQAGYRCTAAGVINMFPHTAHVESIAVFDRDAGLPT
jgi:23S rRNA (uracil1939-C5)-methyltransferase